MQQIGTKEELCFDNFTRHLEIITLCVFSAWLGVSALRLTECVVQLCSDRAAAHKDTDVFLCGNIIIKNFVRRGRRDICFQRGKRQLEFHACTFMESYLNV